jgi:hypothetical protein
VNDDLKNKQEFAIAGTGEGRTFLAEGKSRYKGKKL